MEIIKESKIIKDDFDIDDLKENLDFYRDLLNLREFEVIFKHEKLIESELLLFLSEDLPEFIPFLYYLKWKSIEPYKDKINNSIIIDLENLDITQKTRNDIYSLFQNDFLDQKSMSN